MDAVSLLPCLYAFVACLGFCVIYHIRGLGMVICGLGGTLGWLVYLLVSAAGGSVYFASFLAAVSGSVYSETMARLRKCPVTGYLIVSIFPLVPGAGIYYTMDYFMWGQAEQGMQTGLQTLGIAGCLAVGVLLVSSAVRMYTVFQSRMRKNVK
ncbi:MAG: hypothetical protein H6Q60_38 [Oscillospiraceae bacterium]|nr:hypothetical protein [Oscillospiraceae bacterium]